ncbi:MAG: guanylate kinase [Coriobacteriaceae bacterium]|nr:guanylate kinase [Coriobacteriaceae bacterium]MDO4499058.1 guanylate kinase [Coriobacteriaceae bacterium]MDY3799762.1 guanylate kinase [Eggerthellaceae bacterium]MDY4987435.1 guanylate kinase [Eggerthellaceae bacterium]MDY5371718.1 guanylate kinase [Eggerthellaceae bacterium]
MSRTGNLFVISGPSGAGKGTLVKALIEQVPDAWLSVSATTRKPREGEVDGKHYHFISNDQFDDLVRQDGFLEWAQVHSNKYGTPRAQVEQAIAEGKQAILEIDVQGAFQIKEKIPQSILVFIEPPSLEILEERLRGRGTETEDVIAARMSVATMELLEKIKYDIAIVNDDLDVAAKELVDFVEKQANRPKDC